MNKQGPGKIDWTDYTFNPVTGCYHSCEYCYAERIATRFGARGRLLAMMDSATERHNGYHIFTAKPGERAFPHRFLPTSYPHRLTEPTELKKPSKIFVVSMGDLFGSWVPDSWIEQVLDVVKATPRHTFQFLTQRPDRYSYFTPWPPNAWLGATATNQVELDCSLAALHQVNASVHFISVEPVREFINYITPPLDWLIMGYESGPGCHPKAPDYRVTHLVEEAARLNIPVWLKDSIIPDLVLKEWPEVTNAQV